MSTGRRLAKRSIIGTKVCAPGPDGLWYSGVIQDVKTPPTATITSNYSEIVAVAAAADITIESVIGDTPVVSSDSSSNNNCASSLCGTNLNADTKYIVRFDFKTQTMSDASPSTSKSVIMDARRAAAVVAASNNIHISPAQTLRRNAMIKEFRETDLIGPGFRSMIGIQLQPGQRVFLTYNGRETSGDVISHDANKDEVIVKMTAIGTEEPIELKKRLEEVRLLESRRSARLADQDRDTDFARLADMGGDRRKTSNSIEVPLTQTPLNNPRKRPPSHIHDFNGDQCNEQEEMNECNAALILMKLSNSPKSPNNGDKWLGSSPGSSSASWSSGSSSPPLSDDGHAINTSVMLNDATARIRTTSVSTSDEGIVVDFKEDAPRKKRANKSRFVCTWKGCKFIELTPPKIERHIRNVHLGNKKARRSADYDGSFSESDHEEEFYYTEIEDDDDEGKAPSPTSPPTLSHRDMARPPHEDPEYQRQIVGNFKQGRNTNQQYQLQNQNNSKSIHHGSSYVNSSCNSNNGYHQQLQNSCLPASPLAHHNYTWPSNTAPVTASAAAATGATSTSYNSSAAASSHHHQQQQHSPVSPLIKHARSSPRPSLLTAPYTYVHHHNYSNPSPNNNKNNCSSNSSNGNSPIIHSNSNANDVLQQLSQQNVTVTAHQSVNHHAVAAVAAAATATVHNSHQQQHQLSAVTIVPNYNSHQQQQQQHHHHHPQQQHIRDGHQQQPTASPTSATASNIVAIHTASPAHFQQQQHSHVAMQNSLATAKHTPNSPNRRTRGENKKCRKVYGMERRSEWCTQCRWKKACSRFGD